jgi:hypothetical protein
MKTILAAWQSVLASLKKYIASDYLKKLVVGYAVRAAGITSGFGAWLATIIVKKLYDLGVGAVKKEIIKEETKLENNKDDEAYDKIINDPNATADDIKDALPNFLGGDIKPKP